VSAGKKGNPQDWGLLALHSRRKGAALESWNKYTSKNGEEKGVGGGEGKTEGTLV